MELSVRYCEHLLAVQRAQRSMLSMLSQQFSHLNSLRQVLASFKDGYVSPQVSIFVTFAKICFIAEISLSKAPADPSLRFV